MQKFMSIIILGMVCILMVSCQQELSADSFSTLTIHNESKQFTYEKIEKEESELVTYQLEVEEDTATFSTVIAFLDGEYRSSSTFNRVSLKPVAASKGNSYMIYPEKNWDVFAEYGETLKMTALTASKNEELSLSLPTYYLDNESLIFTIGAIEEKEGLTVNVVVIDAGEVVSYKVSWLGVTTVQVPYGTVECLRVQLEYDGLVLGKKPRLDLWYSDDSYRYLIKYSNKNMELLLKSIN